MTKCFFYGWIYMCAFAEIAAQEKQLTLDDLLPGGNSYNLYVPKTQYDVRWEGDQLIFFNEKESWSASPESIDQKEPFRQAEEKTRIKNEWKNIDFCRENRYTAFTVRNNLYFAQEEGPIVEVAENDDENIVYGQAAHRNEFGIEKGTFWSPKGNYLAFYRMDETGVGDYPLVDISEREAKLKNVKYPMAGMTNQEVKIGIYAVESGKTVYLQTGDPYVYLTNISWNPTEKQVYVAELNREQNHLQLNKYSVETGEKMLTLFEEKNDRYVEPLTPLLFLEKTPDVFIWESQREGYKHLYLYNTEGKLLQVLSPGAGDISQVIGLDEEEKNVLVVSNESHPLDFQIYKINLETGAKAVLTSEAGVHSPLLSRSGKYLIDRYSNLTTPLNIDLISTSDGQTQRLQTAGNPYEGYALPEITLGSLKAADGQTDLYYRLVKPIPFDSAQKYPVVIYVYGGPHSQLVENSWMGKVRGWDIYMAQKGYVVFSLDNRGTSNRGFAFESIIHRQLGKNETADQMKGVEFLRSLPYVDANRIGVHGWSFGGFLSIYLMLQYPEIFKAGVAGGPVTNWELYEIMYGERYMDTPEENPDGYREADMNRRAGNLSGRLLLIHGDEDATVVWQNSLSFLKACVEARTYPDYFVYPGHKHNVHGKDRIHLYENITRYFEDFLKKSPSSSK
ncbi:MAG: DPP IV N-terminal domain-containing protein [Candidatus Azobacteroides sp.]|nr:DPP IV N-terminal domain-containing protein [Candidatus Azobacteroides sp.]